ncbi:MAG: hypothetical protein COA58_01355 [Bacteroidetes bacterium]|nr:MAG: hypothetical protein COA58_01355 [Bacteroidota bacterium]
MKQISYTLLTLLVIVFFSSCDDNGEDLPTFPEITLNGEFNTDLFKAIVKDEAVNKNVIISPLSISSVVKMILAGADGNTAEEIVKSYGEEASKTALLGESQNLRSWLNTRTGSPVIEFSNVLFYDDKKITPLSSYTSDMASYFDASIKTADFSNTEEALATINGWVNEKTKTKIPTIIEDISQNEVMFLINALYLKADWLTSFPEGRTREQTFVLENGNEQMVDMMNMTAGFNTYRGDNMIAVEVPYKDDEISMYFIQPNSGSINTLISELNSSTLAQINDGKEKERLDLYVPKFKLEYKNENIRKSLEFLGVKQMFSQGADLGLMAEQNNLLVSRVVHKTYLTIDEKGTEGAAVTLGGISVTSLPPSVSFNRPFVIVLADKEMKNILFMGRISNPLN